MPIDYKNYPENWKSEIRPAILKRDNNCCKFCGIENGAVGWRDYEGNFVYAEDYLRSKKLGAGFYQTSQRLKIVITIMHLDHNIKNNDYSNLAAGCQKCHNTYDAGFRKENRKNNRSKKLGIITMFE